MATRAFQWIIPLALGIALLGAKLGVEKKIAAFTRVDPLVTLETAQFYARSLRKFSMGLDNFLSNLTWVQLLQGADHTELKDPGVSWEFAKINAINTLDPRFDKAYSFGAAFVSIFRRDEEGAGAILQKWVQMRPNYWFSHYNLGFHLFYDMKDAENGSKHILTASQLPGAPAYLSALGIRILSAAGGYFASLQTAVRLYDSISDDEGKHRLRMRIRSLNYHLQKTAWNDVLEKYRKSHSREPASLDQLPSAQSTVNYSKLIEGSEAAEELRQVLTEKFEFRYDAKEKKVVGILKGTDAVLEKVDVYKQKDKKSGS